MRSKSRRVRRQTRRYTRKSLRRQRGGVINQPTTETFEGIPFIPGARSVIATPEGTMTEKEYRKRAEDPYLTK